MLPSSALFTFDSLPLGLNETDTNRSSSILIYSDIRPSIYTQNSGMMPMIIENRRKTTRRIKNRIILLTKFD